METINDLFNYLDKHGIPGIHQGMFTYCKPAIKGTKSSYEFQSIFKPDLSKFGLTEEEAEFAVIDYVYHTTNIKLSCINELMKMRSIGNKPFFLILNEHYPDKIKYCLAFGRIPGSVIIRDTDKIESLGNIEEIDGDLGFSDSNLKDLGSLKRVSGSIWIAQSGRYIFTQLKTLQNLEFVGGDLSIKNSNIACLGKLKHVGGNLNLRQTFVENLGDLKFIGGNLLLSKDLKGKIKTSNIEFIGKIRYYNDRSLDAILQ